MLPTDGDKSVKKQIRSFINEVISDTLLHANVPGLDEQYQPTGEILWHRGEAADR